MSGGKREARLHHALITVVFMVLIMFVSIVLFDASPHIPLVLGCMAAGLVAVWLGYSWDDILEGMIEGINNSLERLKVADSLSKWNESINKTIGIIISHGAMVRNERYTVFINIIQ